eukprot:8984191-Ditylum_brightwellii.AAC.1
MEDGSTRSIDKMHRSPNAMQVGLTEILDKMNRSPNAMQVGLLMFGECQGHVISWSRLLGEEDLMAKGGNHDVIESSSYLGLQHA